MFWPTSNILKNKASVLFDHRDRVLVKLEITSRPQLCFSFRPQKQQNQMKQCHGWGQDHMQWPMTWYPSTDPSVESTPWKVTPGKLMNILLRSSSDTSTKISTFRKQKRNLKTKNPAHTLLPPYLFSSGTHAFSRAHLHPQVCYLCFASSKFQDPFFCGCNLFPESMQPSSSPFLPPRLSK